ncbi:zona pellucida sperm-binding protein 3-like [Parambassis ranga]|uniref:Zona pellucida sperm-binding protein 3 n=1 Tax=Parambassis ranga TaxID=210632 RepID=A0A6P7IQQ8_9TELE|nr:zona pellucida sperm-binding protein 3-like [Parambassis ranga]
METSHLLVGLLLSGFCVSAFPPAHRRQHALYKRPQLPRSYGSKQQERVNTVSVTCHPDSLEIVIQADMFAVGAPVNSDDLRLGVERDDFCTAAPSSGDEYRILVGFDDCGTKHWMTETSLVYTNLLIYSPVDSPKGVVWMEGAVIPIECHYDRKYSLSSSSLTPTWITFTSTQATAETLAFDLKLMKDDWLYERGANVYHLGETISLEASVRVGHHVGLRVFFSSCVATLDPDVNTEPQYHFIENGCLVDSQLPGSKAHFLPRTQDDKLQLVIDAFKFHDDDRGELYITCHLTAVPVTEVDSKNKACTFMQERWRSADGNDYLCGYCQHQNEVGQTHGKPRSAGRFGPRGFGPRGFGKLVEPEPLKKSRLETDWDRKTVWKQEARVGPLTVLPAQKSAPVPEDELKLDMPFYGSQWRSGINDLKEGPLPTPDLDEEDEVDLGEHEEPLETAASLEVTLEGDGNGTAVLDDISPTTLSNVTGTEPDTIIPIK